MTKSVGGRRGHLSMVPDLPASVMAQDTPTEIPARPVGLFAVLPETEMAGDDAAPAGTKVADLLQGLIDSGAPRPFLDRAAAFGEDVQGLFAWLRDFGPVWSEQQWAADILDHWTPLLLPGTRSIDAEVEGATFLSMYEQDPDMAEGLDYLIARVAATGRREAVAMLRVLTQLGPAEIRSTARNAADQLVAAGVVELSWALDLDTDRWVSAWGITDPVRSQLTLLVEFQAGNSTYGFAILIDNGHGGGVMDCWFTGEFEALKEQMRGAAMVTGLGLDRYTHRQAGVLLTDALSAPVCPGAPDQVDNVHTLLPLLRSRLPLVAVPTQIAMLSDVESFSNVLRLPRSAPPAIASARPEVYRIKVMLTGTRPSIWRRLELSSSTTLDKLHHILQAAFGWSGTHLWCFEVLGREYGDPEMDFLDATGARLGVLAPLVGAKLAYVYDFGDNWRFALTVESISPPADDVRYPRCTAGRRAAPPEDCGGPDAYRELLKSLLPVAHTHSSRTPRLASVDRTRAFDPAEFSLAEVDERLSDS